MTGEGGCTRIWRDERFEVLAFDDGEHLVQRASDGAIIALGSAEDRVLVEGAGPGLRLAATGGGRLLVHEGGVLRLLGRAGLRELRRITLGGQLGAARLVTGGVFFVQRLNDEASEYIWSPDGGRQESFGQTSTLSQGCYPALAADGRHLAWFVCRQERDLKSALRFDDGRSVAQYSLGVRELDLARLDLDSGRLVVTELPAPVRSLAVSGGRTWLLLHRSAASVLIGLWDGGDVKYQDLPAALGELTVVGAYAFALQPRIDDKPATLWRIALDTGRAEPVASAREGHLFNLIAGGGAVHWLEGQHQSSLLMASIFGGATGPAGSAVCTLPLGPAPEQLAAKKKATKKLKPRAPKKASSKRRK